MPAESSNNTGSEDGAIISEHTTTAKATNSSDILTEQSSVTTLEIDNESPNEAAIKTVSVVLTQAGPVTSDQLEINQLIDNLIDDGWLSYVNIAALCFSSPQEKNELLKPLLDGIKKFQSKYVNQRCLHACMRLSIIHRCNEFFRS